MNLTEKIKTFSTRFFSKTSLLTLLEIIFLYFSVYLIIYGTGCIIKFLHLKKINSYGGFIIIWGMFLFPLIWERAIKKVSLKETGFKWPENMTEIFTGIIFLSIILIYNYLTAPHIKLNNINTVFNLLHILNCFSIALSEETFFRGILLRRFARLWGKYTAIVLTSVIFSFAGHPDAIFLENLIWRFPVSLTLSYLYTRKDNLFLPVSIHMFLNLFLLRP